MRAPGGNKLTESGVILVAISELKAKQDEQNEQMKMMFNRLDKIEMGRRRDQAAGRTYDESLRMLCEVGVLKSRRAYADMIKREDIIDVIKRRRGTA